MVPALNGNIRRKHMETQTTSQTGDIAVQRVQAQKFLFMSGGSLENLL